MPDELLGPLFDDLGLHQRPEGSHDAAKEMAATSESFSLYMQPVAKTEED